MMDTASNTPLPELTRRSFLLGLGASIVAAALPAIVISESPERIMPPIVLKTQWDIYHGFTEKYFAECLREIFEQVKAMSYLNPSRREREAIAKNIDDVLGEIRPAGLRIDMKIPFDKMITGEFEFREVGAGTVQVT
jgi:hypothetical protein